MASALGCTVVDCAYSALLFVALKPIPATLEEPELWLPTGALEEKAYSAPEQCASTLVLLPQITKVPVTSGKPAEIFLLKILLTRVFKNSYKNIYFLIRTTKSISIILGKQFY